MTCFLRGQPNASVEMVQAEFERYLPPDRVGYVRPLTDDDRKIGIPIGITDGYFDADGVLCAAMDNFAELLNAVKNNQCVALPRH